MPEVVRAVKVGGLTYLGEDALCDLHAAVLDVERRGLPGALVEAGCARGGSAIVMAAAKAPSRPFYVYDVFGMIPPPSAKDDADVHARYRVIAGGGAAGIGGRPYYGYEDDLLGQVAASFGQLGLPVAEHQVHLVPGLFEETLRLEESVALAHLDGDWYASVLTCLERLAPLLVPGGRLIIDDYDDWSGCRKAVDHYFRTIGDAFRFERQARLHVVRR